MKNPTSSSSKSLLSSLAPSFDLKFMLVGSPGAGKTHLCGTYTSGPIHFYMVDPGGEKTLRKLLPDRPDSSPISVDTFLRRDNQDYQSLWNQLQKDAKSGFFEEMKEKSGLIVFDSMTSIMSLITDYVEKLSGKSPMKPGDRSGFSQREWGQRSSFATELIRVINDIPGAAAVCTHLKRTQDNLSGNIIESLNLPGQLSDSAGNWFDEVYKIKAISKKIRLIFHSDGSFDQAKTRTFEDSYKDFQRGEMALDQIVSAYFNGGKF